VIYNPGILPGYVGFQQLLAVAVMRSVPLIPLFALLFALLVLLLYLWQRRRFRRKLRQRVASLKAELARDFHDALGGKLTVINLYGELARQSLEQAKDPVAARSHLDKVVATSRQLYTAMKDLIWTLGRSEAAGADPWLRIEQYGQELFDGSVVQFQYACTREVRQVRLSAEARRHLVLLVKEALHNALRHARAEQVILSASLVEGALLVCVEDDGQGFGGREVLAKANGGIWNMRMRARHLGGSLSLHSEGRGTRIQLRCPVAGNTALMSTS
jgi:signal transduction histidine kinase